MSDEIDLDDYRLIRGVDLSDSGLDGYVATIEQNIKGCKGVSASVVTAPAASTVPFIPSRFYDEDEWGGPGFDRHEVEKECAREAIAAADA